MRCFKLGLRKRLCSVLIFIALLVLAMACGGGGGSSSTTTAPTTAPAITTQPASLTINSGSSAVFAVAALGNPSPTFIWRRSNDGGSSWTTISGATSSTYSFTTSKSDNLAQFQAIATNSLSSVTSDAATLVLRWLALTSQPTGKAVTAPNQATFTVSVDANPTPTYQWQSSADGTSWSSIPVATASSYTTPATSVGNNGTQYRCVISNAATTLTSDPATLTVNAPLAAPVFITQPESLTANSGSSASFTVAASGNPSPTFTWRRSNDGGVTWTTIPGAVSSTYSFTPRYSDDAAQFQAMATNSVNTVNSHPATLTVTPMVYAAGYIINGSNVTLPGYWLNGTWVGLSGADGSQIKSLVVAGNDVYAGGDYNSGYWKNNANVALPLPAGASGGFVNSIAVSGNDVYVAGYINGPSFLRPGYWLNGTWVALAIPSGMPAGVVYSLVVSGSDVYAAGSAWANSAGNAAAGYWLNGAWVDLAPPLPSADSGAYCPVVTSNDVYVGGYSRDSSNMSMPGYWLNGTWVSLTPSGAQGATITSLVVNGTGIYAAGRMVNSFGNRPGYWLNGTWVDLTPPPGSSGFSTNSLVVTGNEVYAAGGVINNGVALPGYWMNGSWVGLTLPSGSKSGEVNCLVFQ